MKIIITESQLRNIVKNILNEEIPYQIAQKYLKTSRNPEAEEKIKQVFTNLKSLPNAQQIENNEGQRISFPYSEDSTEDEIENILKKYQFTIKDYRNNLAIDMKNNRGISLSKALSIVSKKEPDVKELMDRYATIKSKGVIDKEDLIIIFSSSKYDIAGMSTDRNWDSCMNVITGGNRKYVETDIREGTIICYLTKASDTNIKKPLGRVLIKPYINVQNEKDVILYAEDKTYGNIPNSSFFIYLIDTYMEKIQNLSGTYSRLGCLYKDSYRSQIQKREDVEKKLKQKLEIKDYHSITNLEFLYLSTIDKRKLLDIYLSSDFLLKLSPIHVKYMSQSQKVTYFKLLFKENKTLNIDVNIFREAPLAIKKEIITFKLENNIYLNEYEYEISTPEQKEKYIKQRYYLNIRTIPDKIFIGAPEHIKKEIIDLLLKNNETLNNYHYKNATTEQKEKYVKSFFERMDKGDWFLGFQEKIDYFQYLPKDMKKEYIDLMLKYRRYLNDIELNSTTPKQKEKYIKFLKENLNLKLLDTSSLYKHEFDLLTIEQKHKHNNLLLRKIYDTIKPLPPNGFGWVENRLEPHEFDLLTLEQKRKYIDLILSHRYTLRDYEDMVATKNQKNKNKTLNHIVRAQRMGIQHEK